MNEPSIMNTLRIGLEIKGVDIAMDGPQCVIWKADHTNCVGCPSQLGCSKLAACGIVNLYWVDQLSHGIEVSESTVFQTLDSIASASKEELDNIVHEHSISRQRR